MQSRKEEENEEQRQQRQRRNRARLQRHTIGRRRKSKVGGFESDVIVIPLSRFPLSVALRSLV